MVDFDDGYGDPSDYGMEQSDFDAASAVGAQTYQDNQDNQNQQFGIGSGDGIDSSEGNIRDPSIGFGNDTYRQFSDDMLQNYLRAGSVNPYSSLNALNNFAGGAGDFGINGSRMGLNTALANLYTKERGASNINPFPEGPFGIETIFGKVDRTKDLGSQRIQEINDLRARQAFGLPSLNTGKDYTGRDYYGGQETVYGTAEPLPMGGLETLVNMMPGISGVKALFGGGRNLPPNHPEMIRLRAEAEAEANEPGILDRIESGLSNFGTDVYNSFSETGGAIGDFLTNMITKSGRYMDNKFYGSNLNSGVFSAGDNSAAKVGKEQLNSMNRDGTGYASAAGSLYPRTTENSPNYTVPGEENLGMTIDRTGLDRYNLNSVDPNFKTEMNKLNSDEREFLTGRTDNIGITSLDPVANDAVTSALANDINLDTRKIQTSQNDKNARGVEAYKDPETRLHSNYSVHMQLYRNRNR
jgi:hypothetical protein